MREYFYLKNDSYEVNVAQIKTLKKYIIKNKWSNKRKNKYILKLLCNLPAIDLGSVYPRIIRSDKPENKGITIEAMHSYTNAIIDILIK